MTARQQWLVVGAVVATLAGGLFAVTRILGDELFPVTVGSEAPRFQARTVDGTGAGTMKSSADYEGQVVLLNIWATWCLPCRVEMPSIERLHREFAPKGLKVVAVSIDAPGEERKIRDFVREYGLTFEILYEPSGSIQRTFQTTGVPETFVIGRDGVIRKKAISSLNWSSEANRALVAQLLAEPAG
jgi:peroxiredoxin